MFKRWFATLLLLCLGGVFLPVQATPVDLKHLATAPYVPDRVLVKFRPGLAAQERSRMHAQAQGRVLSVFEHIGVQLVAVPLGSVRAAIRVYESNPNVIYAEPDYYRLLRMPDEEPGPTLAGGANYFDEQWYLHNQGQDHTYIRTSIWGSEPAVTRGSEGADINAPEAWDINTGRVMLDSADRTIPKVAVLDSGADCNTLELQGKCIEQVNLVGLTAGLWGDSCTAEEPACDNLGHGTFVSSEVAANTDNGEGIAGIGWNTGLGIFKVCYQELITDGVNYFLAGLCPVSGSIAAIQQASQDRLDGDNALVRSRYSVITMSYGSDWIDESGNITPTTVSNAECDAIAVAVSRGVLVVAAAGNNGDTGRVYPAACTDADGNSTVMAVAASDHHDDRADFSTYSWPTDPWVSLSAPGEAIIGILPDASCNLAPGTDSCVDWWDGTSMAAPLVAGGAALVWAELYDAFPDLAASWPCELDGVACNLKVRQLLQENAAAVGARGQNLRDWSRFGRLDVAAALAAVSGTEPPPVYTAPIAAFSYECTGFECDFIGTLSTGTGPLDYTWALGDGNTLEGVDRVDNYVYDGSGRYTLRLTVTDGINASEATTTLNLKRPNQHHSGTVTAEGSGGTDSGGGGNCPPKKREKGQC